MRFLVAVLCVTAALCLAGVAVASPNSPIPRSPDASAAGQQLLRDADKFMQTKAYQQALAAADQVAAGNSGSPGGGLDWWAIVLISAGGLIVLTGVTYAGWQLEHHRPLLHH